MSDQGPLPDRRDDFGLIETLLWTRDRGYDLLEEHLARLARSSEELGFSFDERQARTALSSIIPTGAASPLPQSGGGLGRRPAGDVGETDAPPPHPSPASREREQAAAHAERLRVRLVLSRDGAIDITSAPIEPTPPETIWRVVLAGPRFPSQSPLLRHKTTRRALYEDELARAMREQGADEVLFLNERDELCESARCNLFVPDDNILLTPPLSCGLLPGTLRASLLAQGGAREAVLHAGDLSRGFFLGNSVRGLVRARLV